MIKMPYLPFEELRAKYPQPVRDYAAMVELYRDNQLVPLEDLLALNEPDELAALMEAGKVTESGLQRVGKLETVRGWQASNRALLNSAAELLAE